MTLNTAATIGLSSMNATAIARWTAQKNNTNKVATPKLQFTKVTKNHKSTFLSKIKFPLKKDEKLLLYELLNKQT